MILVNISSISFDELSYPVLQEDSLSGLHRSRKTGLGSPANIFILVIRIKLNNIPQ
jgi:hypothetical protein